MSCGGNCKCGGNCRCGKAAESFSADADWVIKDENYSHWDFTGTEAEAKEYAKNKKLVGWGLFTEVEKGKWLVITQDERGYEYEGDVDGDKNLAKQEEPLKYIDTWPYDAESFSADENKGYCVYCGEGSQIGIGGDYLPSCGKYVCTDIGDCYTDHLERCGVCAEIENKNWNNPNFFIWDYKKDAESHDFSQKSAESFATEFEEKLCGNCDGHIESGMGFTIPPYHSPHTIWCESCYDYHFEAESFSAEGLICEHCENDYETEIIEDFHNYGNIWCNWCGQVTERNAESFSASEQKACHRCGKTEKDGKLWWVGSRKGFICGPCSEGGVKYRAESFSAEEFRAIERFDRVTDEFIGERDWEGFSPDNFEDAQDDLFRYIHDSKRDDRTKMAMVAIYLQGKDNLGKMVEKEYGAESFSAQEYGTNCNTCGGFLKDCIGYIDGEPCNQAGSEPRLCTKCEDDIRCSSCKALYFYYGGENPYCEGCDQFIGYDPISNLHYSNSCYCIDESVNEEWVNQPAKEEHNQTRFYRNLGVGAALVAGLAYWFKR